MSGKLLLFALATLVMSPLVLSKPAEDPDRVLTRAARKAGPRLPVESQPRGRPSRPIPHRPRPHGGCTCDEPRLGQVERDLADLVRRMGEMESRNKEDDVNIQNLQDSNRRQQAQISRVVGENQRLTRLTRSLQSRAETLEEDNSQLRDENERLRTVQDQPQPAVNQRTRSPEEVNDGPVANQRSSMRDLNDVMGNREAEMIEMGVFPPVKPSRPEGPPLGRPDRRPGSTFGSSGPTSKLPDSEQIATSLLAMNQENEILKRRLGELEGRMNQQGRQPLTPGSARGKPGPQLRPVPPPGQSSDELAEKISQLERLVLVALRNPSAQSRGQSGLQRPAPDVPPSRRGSIPAKSQAVAVDNMQMTDDDLEAMSDVLDRVQNKSPGKSAFSVASTGITVGATNDPRAIEFDHEYVNKGGDFDMRRNRFVCENRGFYYVTFTLRSYDNKYLGVALMKNEELETAVYADSSERNVMQSQAVILHMEPGDELWLRHAPSEHFAVHSGEHRFVTFSGYLIYRGR
ncbi:uncharacterized protein LOC119724264 [Patiria miniata]|uniref:C1q domain-containing protein n=1 Tax=Patiria miniata TaxID=46514 RepID=A0A913ZJD8_PATMI|nr:uncharacterized protein LOC119724264 [Patiria miniata]